MRNSKEYPLNPKTIFGLSTMRFTLVATSSLMTSAFMLYLTDYSGLKNAAAVTTILLLVGRILDAVDDPLQGWLMDNSLKTKIGKFKPFMLGGIFAATVALILLFNMPLGISEPLQIAFLFFSYILLEVGTSFQPDYAIKSSMTQDTKVREKLLITPRIVETIIAVPFSFFIALALQLSNSLGGNNHSGFGLAAVVMVLPLGALAFIGACLVKEGPYAVQNEQKLGIRDIARMFKENKSFWVSQLSGLIGGCCFVFITAAVTYYIKWAYGPENFGTNSAIWGGVILLGMIIGTTLASPMLKKRSPVQGMTICYLGQSIPLVIIFVLNLLGTVTPYLFWPLMLITIMFLGMSYIPGSIINMECMDFNRWTRGTGMEGMIQAVNNFSIKAQTALAGLATGAVLIAINYAAAFYESEQFLTSGQSIPKELYTGLSIVFCLIPIILAVISLLILRAYPLKGELREQMYRELEKRESTT